MSPTPIYPTPTPDTREAFMRAAWAAGFGWNAPPPLTLAEEQRQIRGARNASSYTHVYLRDRCFVFVDGFTTLGEIIDRGTIVNSPRHFIAYAKRYRLV